MKRIVTWLEWSDLSMSLHDNRGGRASETLLGIITQSPNGWEARDASDPQDKQGKLVGVFKTRHEASVALLDHFQAAELKVWN